MVVQDVSLDDMKGMQLKREADDMYDAAIDTDFSKGAESLMEGLNMTGFNKDRENDAKQKISGLENQEKGTPEDLLAELYDDGNGKFNDPEIPENQKSVDSELYNIETYSGQIRTRMAERFDTENGGNAELLEAQLSTAEGKNQNKKQIDTLFFGTGVLEDSLSDMPKAEKKENLDWFEANTSEGGPLEKSFERIKGNFVLPIELQDRPLSEIHEENPENSKIVNDALADAILLEVAVYTTQGKVNYSEVAVKALIYDIKNIKTPAAEKIRKFGEIHSIVNTGIAKGAKKTREFRERRLAGRQAEEESKDFYIAQAETTKRNQTPVASEINNETTTIADTPKSGDIFTAGKLDGAKIGNESGSEETV